MGNRPALQGALAAGLSTQSGFGFIAQAQRLGLPGAAPSLTGVPAIATASAIAERASGKRCFMNWLLGLWGRVP